MRRIFINMSWLIFRKFHWLWLSVNWFLWIAHSLYRTSIQQRQEKIGNVQGKAATLHQLAGIYADQGEVAKAIAFYEQSLELEEKIGDLRGKAATFGRLGQLLADKKGDFDKALNYLQQSLDILQHLRSPDAETVRRIIAEVQRMADGWRKFSPILCRPKPACGNLKSKNSYTKRYIFVTIGASMFSAAPLLTF